MIAVVIFYAFVIFVATFIFRNIIKDKDENIEEDENRKV